MAVIRLYRKFYRINPVVSGDTYNLINPTSITTNVYLKDASTLIESPTHITKESEGVYYVDLSANLYSYDSTYDLKWTVKYLEDAPLKILTTTFKLNPINIAASDIYTEFESQIINASVENQTITTNIDSGVVNANVENNGINANNDNNIIEVIIL